MNSGVTLKHAGGKNPQWRLCVMVSAAVRRRRGGDHKIRFENYLMTFFVFNVDVKDREEPSGSEINR